jgi:hypothetical protein
MSIDFLSQNKKEGEQKKTPIPNDVKYHLPPDIFRGKKTEKQERKPEMKPAIPSSPPASHEKAAYIRFHEPEGIFWKSKQKVRVNLASPEIVVTEEVRNERKFLVIILSCVFAFILILSSYSFLYINGSKLRKEFLLLSKESVSMNNTLSVSQDRLDRFLEDQRQILGIGTLLTEHRHWLKFFHFIEENTLSDVYYSAISIQKNGKVILSAIAPNYNAVSRQMKAFQDQEQTVRDVTVLSARQEERKERIEAGVVTQKLILFDIQIDIEGEFLKR